MRDYLLFQLKDLQSLKPWPHHVINHCDGITTKELGLLIHQVLKIKSHQYQYKISFDI